MNKNNQLVLAIVIVIVLVGLIWYGTSKKQIPSSKEPIKIGFVGPFSGPAAQFGQFMQNGLDLALEKLPPEEKNRIIIVKEDDQCKGTPAVSAIQKLIFVDKVAYVIGPLCNEASVATEQLFEENKVFSITIGLPSNKIANMGLYHFSFSPEIDYLMKTLSEYITNQGIKKVGVIYFNDAFGQENHTHFVKYFTSSSGAIVTDEGIQKGETDVKGIVLKIKKSKPDAVMMMAYGASVISILKELKIQGLDKLPKFSIHAFETPDILKNVPELAEGTIYPYPADRIPTKTAIEYMQVYKNRFNMDVDPYSANVYDSFNILLQAIKKCGAKSKQCIGQELASIKNYEGANGLLSVDSRGVGTYKEIMLKIVKAGKFVKLEE